MNISITPIFVRMKRDDFEGEKSVLTNANPLSYSSKICVSGVTTDTHMVYESRIKIRGSSQEL